MLWMYETIITDLGLCLHALPGEREHLHLAGGESDGHDG
jgi:hypothetical protein